MALQPRKDILLDDANDVRTLNGDFLIGDSDAQHVATILQASPGNFLEDGIIGCGLGDYRNGSVSTAELQKKARVHLQRDGYLVKSATLNSEGQILVDAQPFR